MRIATRLYINAVLTVAMVLVLGLASLVAFLVDKEVMQRMAVANDLRAWAYELNVIGSRYLRHPGERAREQWRLRHSSLADALQRVPAGGPGEQVIVRRMKRSLDDLQRIFNYLLAVEAKEQPVSPDLQDQLAVLMLQESREITLDATRLAKESERKTEKIDRSITLYLPFTAAVLLGISLILSFRIGRSIAAPIARLRAGAEIFGSGRLDHRIGRRSDDELGQLAGAFDRMAEDLLTTTVSREELAREVAERRRAEEEIRCLNTTLAARAADLEAANRELETFNYTVAHDLRTPLTVISGYIEILKEMCKSDIPSECREYLQDAYDGTMKMSQLIDALLEFSRLARIEPKWERVDLCAMAQEVVNELRLAEPKRQVTSRIADTGEATGDPSLLRVVLANLLGNAWKFTRVRDEAVIEFGMAEIGGETTWFVRDNGPGFSMAEAIRIFVPFQRLRGTADSGGHGIGLATVERIIQRHGGRIWAEGEPGKGATFYFILPPESGK